jgi:hypothetical protein
VIKLGVVMLVIGFAYLWTALPLAASWSWVRQLGTTSLLVYWVHIELVYGRWLWFLKNNLTVAQTAATACGVILLMLAISTAKTRRHRIAAVLANWGWTIGPKPERVPGD